MSSTIGRLAVEGWPPSSMEQGQRLLAEGLARLPAPVEYLVGPGGYLTVLDPIIGTMPSGWESQPDAIERLRPIASAVSRTLVGAIPAQLRRRAKYFSYGLDVRDTDPNKWKDAELVLVSDMWTGDLVLLTAKTYPTEDQTRTLVRAVDWDSHLWLPGNGDRVIVLGCHDLNVYNNRAYTNAAKDPNGRKLMLLNEGRETFSAFKPTHILHHPHATDIANTWRGAWSGVRRIHPYLTQGASGIGHPKLKSRDSDDIRVVLAATQVPKCASVDVVVRGNAQSHGRQADVIPANLDDEVTEEEFAEDYKLEMEKYERGMREYEYFQKYGTKVHPRARSTKPSPPSKKRHTRVEATKSNSCPNVTYASSGALGASSVLPSVALGVVLGAGVMHLAKRR